MNQEIQIGTKVAAPLSKTPGVVQGIQACNRTGKTYYDVKWETGHVARALADYEFLVEDSKETNPPGADSLSRAASAVRAIRESHALAAEYDAGFDGGEFSAAAHGDAEQQETAAVVSRFGFTPASYNRELAARTTPRFAHFSGLEVAEAGNE